jgi:hypothetical protein
MVYEVVFCGEREQYLLLLNQFKSIPRLTNVVEYIGTLKEQQQ